jgi:predicted  nucleic acid-binding Zn-ribbon protein
MSEKTKVNYSFYSKVLEKPFDTVDELLKAEEIHAAEIKAKEDKAAAKKADALKVEEAFKALNAARKIYKEKLIAITEEYSEELKAIKEAFEDAKAVAHNELVAAEENYSTYLKAFTDKYKEGFHLTLKDGDFETTLSSKQTSGAGKAYTVSDLFDWMFR